MRVLPERLAAALADRYRLERELGRGGMATVYLAEDLKHKRQVAVKVLKPELGAVLGAERFINEIRTTANLQHPNLLPLFDSGEADGHLFYVMPYVEGETLRARLETERQLPVDETVRLISLLAGALDFAHARGVVHRDLKPENILLQAGQPIIADFGIALAVAEAGGERVTQTGLSLGTPHYMSPEQAAGSHTVDARSDQYALGATAYEMLTGEPPHTGPTTPAIVARLMTEKPRDIRATRPAVPTGVDAAIQRALEKSPAEAALTQDALARAAGTSQPTVAAYEAGRKSPTLDTVQRLAKAVGLEAEVVYHRPPTREDRRSLELHRVIAARLTEDPKGVVALARRNLARMRAHPGQATQLLREWGVLLDRPLSALLLVLTDPGEWARELRHVTPFADVLSAAERSAVYRAFADAERQAS